MKANYYAASVQVSQDKDKREKHVRILSVAKQSSEAKLTGGFWLHQLSAYSFSGLSLCTVDFTRKIYYRIIILTLTCFLPIRPRALVRPSV